MMNESPFNARKTTLVNYNPQNYTQKKIENMVERRVTANNSGTKEYQKKYVEMEKEKARVINSASNATYKISSSDSSKPLFSDQGYVPDRDGMKESKLLVNGSIGNGSENVYNKNSNTEIMHNRIDKMRRQMGKF